MVTTCESVLHGRSGVDARSLPPQDGPNRVLGHEA